MHLLLDSVRELNSRRWPETPSRRIETPAEPPQGRTITIRMSPSQHRALRSEAFRQQVSMNTLCLDAFAHYFDSPPVPLHDGDDETETERTENLATAGCHDDVHMAAGPADAR